MHKDWSLPERGYLVNNVDKFWENILEMSQADKLNISKQYYKKMR